jgi:glycosyltransferase involved in cell wall biosynthesis
MLKVIFPFVGDSVGGSHQSIIELHKNLTKRNILSSIVVHKKGPLSLMLDDSEIKYIYLPIDTFAGESPNLFSIAYSIVKNFITIGRFIKNNNVSIVHGNDLRINLTWSLPTKFSKATYVWHQRSLMSSSKLWRISVVMADHFVAISKFVYNSLPKNIPRSKKTLILNPFNIKRQYERTSSREWLNDLYNIPKEDILIGYIGRIVYWKNVDFLVECFAKYIQKDSAALHLIIVGSGDYEYIEKIKQILEKLGIKNVVTFAGFNSFPDRVISGFDLMIAPSNQEPFGRTLVEAMLQRTPVLACKGAGHSEIIDDGKTGSVYAHNNIDDFVKKFAININDEVYKSKIVKNAYIMATSKYSSDRHTEGIIKIYNQLLYS